MSKYAKINQENIVENTIECEDSNISLFLGAYIKVTESTKDTNAGDFWDPENKKFINPKPYESWILDENFNWVSPSGESFLIGHYWDEDSQEWVAIPNTEE